MEKTVLVSPKVEESFKKLELASLYTDANNDQERANLEMQTKRFGDSVIPAYYVVDPKTGKVLSSKVGACSVDEFVEFLERGVAAYPR